MHGRACPAATNSKTAVGRSPLQISLGSLSGLLFLITGQTEEPKGGLGRKTTRELQEVEVLAQHLNRFWRSPHGRQQMDGLTREKEMRNLDLLWWLACPLQQVASRLHRASQPHLCKTSWCGCSGPGGIQPNQAFHVSEAQTSDCFCRNQTHDVNGGVAWLDSCQAWSAVGGGVGITRWFSVAGQALLAAGTDLGLTDLREEPCTK